MVDQPVKRQPMVLPDLSRKKRWTVGLGGFCSFALGSVAVFTTSNSLGAGVLLIVGAVALLCALLGFIPQMGFGGSLIDPRREPGPDAVEGVEETRLAVQEALEQFGLGNLDSREASELTELIDERAEQVEVDVMTAWFLSEWPELGRLLYNRDGPSTHKLTDRGGREWWIYIDPNTHQVLHREDQGRRGKHSEVMDIAALVGAPDPGLGTGSTVPRALFEAVCERLGLDASGSSPEMAQRIVTAANLPYSPDLFEGRGSTITLAGLQQVKEAVRRLLRERATGSNARSPMPPE